MKKTAIVCLLFFLLSSLIITLSFGVASAEEGVVTQGFANPAPGFTDFVQPWLNWDLTKADLTVSYSLDMSAYSGSQASEVGIVDHDASKYKGMAGGVGCLGAIAPGTEQYDNNFDENDMLTLGTAVAFDNAYMTYDVAKTGDDAYSTYPWWPLGNVWDPWASCGVWFDRAKADGTLRGGLYDGKMCNTGGKYDVTITYHAFDADRGAMFATVNGVPQGFYGLYDPPFAGLPQYTPAGKVIIGDMTSVQVYAKAAGKGVSITNLKATGYAEAPTLTGVYQQPWLTPPAAEQGDNIKGLLLSGTGFRPVPATVQLKLDSIASITASSVYFLDKSWVSADIKIPENARVGQYDTNYWHNDDPTKVASLPDSFNVSYAKPVVSSSGDAHSRPNQTVTVTITGQHFRNTPMNVKLVRGDESITGKNIRWISSTQIKVDFTIPANATIGRDWDIHLAHQDDGKIATMAHAFSVDARMDIINPFGVFNWIWLKAPGILKVVLYSEGNFDATTVIPLAVDLGGTFPIACNPQDVNRDGKVDQVFYFNNMAVNLPVGYYRPVRMICADGSFKSIQAWDTVKVFRLFFW
jgi:IPT/TIG domain